MFTGIVEATAKINKISVLGKSTSPSSEDAYVIELETPASFMGEGRMGDSIAVNGCCLTLTAAPKATLNFVVSHETWNVTTFSSLKEGDWVNLERAMTLNQRLDGHLVSGHVDSHCTITRIIEIGQSRDIFISVPARYAALFIPKGSITIDGVSLTINDIKDLPEGDQELRFTLIPHTIEVTRFKYLHVGSKVNVEFDMMAKFVQRLMQKDPPS